MEGRMKEFRILASILMVAMFAGALSGCTTNDYGPAAYQTPVTVPTYDVAPQVIYRIDGHRFISLENYDRCFGDNYYNDTRTGVHTKLLRGNSFATFRGRLIVDDPSDINIVIPSAPQRPCGDRGCKVPLYYSTNGGRTFNAIPYMNSSYPPVDSENYTIVVTKDSFFVEKLISKITGHVSTDRYPLIPGFVYGTDEKLPDDKRIESNVPMQSGLRTPSGQDRFTCDESIRPSNLPKPQ
jgi:hypothetical protein